MLKKSHSLIGYQQFSSLLLVDPEGLADAHKSLGLGQEERVRSVG